MSSAALIVYNYVMSEREKLDRGELNHHNVNHNKHIDPEVLKKVQEKYKELVNLRQDLIQHGNLNPNQLKKMNSSLDRLRKRIDRVSMQSSQEDGEPSLRQARRAKRRVSSNQTEALHPPASSAADFGPSDHKE